MNSITDLMTSVTATETYERYLSSLETLGVSARSWRVGGALRTILRVIASNFAEMSAVVAQFAKGAYLETAEGGWLTLLAQYVYGETRLVATQAKGTLRMVNSGGGVYSFAADQMRVLHSVSGKAYRNTTAFTLTAGQTLDIEIAAVELGTDSNAGPNEITELETTMLLVTVTNPASVVGTDDETDADLRTRCRDKLATLSNGGPRRAYSYAIRVAKRTDGTPVLINRIRASSSSSTGQVNIIVASANGAAVADDITAATSSVNTIARPDCVTVSVVSATTVAIARDLTVWALQSDVTATELEARIREAVATAVSTYPIGGFVKLPSTQGWWFSAFLAGTVKASDPSIYAVDGVGADVALDTDEVPLVTLTISVRLVEPN